MQTACKSAAIVLMTGFAVHAGPPPAAPATATAPVAASPTSVEPLSAKKLITAADNTVDADPRQIQIQAATANAAAALREQISHTLLSRNVKIRDFLDCAQAADQLEKLVQSAQPVGGPRWVDAHTCQVQLEVPGLTVADLLRRAAAAHPEKLPLSGDALNARVRDWTSLQFPASGSSAGGDSIELARPLQATGKWSEIDEHTRRMAVATAKQAAIDQALQSLETVSLDDHRTLKDALAHPLIHDHLAAWLKRQPISQIDFQDDLKVQLSLSLSDKTFPKAVRAAVLADASYAHDSHFDWDRVQDEIKRLPDSATGYATASLPAAKPSHSALDNASALNGSDLTATALPSDPPDWVDQQLDAEAVSHSGATRLKVGQNAQHDAVEKLRSQFMALKLGIGKLQTVGDAAQADPQVAAAVERALRLAKAGQIDYQRDGSVKVQMSLDLHDAWDAMRSYP